MKPTAFVFNTDNHKKCGTHWVAAYVNESSRGWYFDSFGLPPIIPHHIKRIRKNCKNFRWNSIQLQSENSDVCGHFCIMFLYYMSANLGIGKFLQNFSDDLKANDAIARNFVCVEKLDNSNAYTGDGCCFVRCLQKSCDSSFKLSLL